MYLIHYFSQKIFALLLVLAVNVLSPIIHADTKNISFSDTLSPPWCAANKQIQRSIPTTQRRNIIKLDPTGIGEEQEIQKAINAAHSHWVNTRERTHIQLLASNPTHIFLVNPIRLRSGVYLSGEHITIHPKSIMKSLVVFPNNTKDAGFNLFSLQTDNTLDEYKITHSMVNIHRNSSNISIYNNHYTGEEVSARNQTNYGSDIHAISVQYGSTNLHIADNNFFWTPTAIALIASRSPIRNALIENNSISGFRRRAIYVSTKLLNGTEDIQISGNRISATAELNGSKQPIAFQISEGGSHLRPIVYRNNITSERQPHIRGVSNHGTADNISIHRGIDSLVTHNCVTNAGELGINFSLGTRNSQMICNYVFSSDLTGINVQSTAKYSEAIYETQDITLSHNIITHAGVNAEQVRTELIGGIYIDRTTEVKLNNNLIVNSINLGADIYLRDSDQIEIIDTMKLDDPGSNPKLILLRSNDVSINNMKLNSPKKLNLSLPYFKINSTVNNQSQTTAYQNILKYCLTR